MTPGDAGALPIGAEVMVSLREGAEERGEQWGMIVGSTHRDPKDAKAWPVILMPEDEVTRWPIRDYYVRGIRHTTGGPMGPVDPERLRLAEAWDATWRTRTTSATSPVAGR